MRSTFFARFVACSVAASVVPACTAPEESAPTVSTASSSLFTQNGTVVDEATIYENATTSNGGIYSDICIGNLNTTTTTRRAFVRYTLPAIPAGSTITRVQISFTQDLVRRTGGPLAATLELREVTSAWTEGSGGTNTRSCGGGTVSAGVTWATAPIVSGTLSATAALGTADGATVTMDTNVGATNDELINDVQGWVNGGTNNGWALTLSAVTEATANNARSMTPGTLTISWTRANGGTCTQDDDCTSNSCVFTDGTDCAGRAGCVCCSAATCSAVCESCFLAGSVGTCAARPNTTSCRGASCTAGVATLAANCDGSAHSCPAATTQDCSPYTSCNATVCATTCQSASECDPGYFCNGTSMCELVTDECAQGLDDCVPLATCNDPTTAVGDFTCTCPTGYAGNGHGGAGTGCTDIDECAANTDDCDPNATCANTAGSFTCTCNPGWAGNGKTCTDVDECTANTDDCDVNAMCANTAGSFTCTCNAGWAGNGKACTDVDECATNAHDCNINATCTNTNGSFMCACNAPFWTGDGRACTDVDECATGTVCGANEVCVNELGAANTCVCAAGFSRASAMEPCLANTTPDGGGCCQSNGETNLVPWLLAAIPLIRRRRRLDRRG